MKIKWLGQSTFIITSEEGVKIITDPYHVSGGIKYAPINESADIVTISHNHGDHNNSSAIHDDPQIISKAGITKFKGIDIKGVSSYHDSERGRILGGNIIFCFTVNNIYVCHLGDLGHLLTKIQRKKIGQVDILIIPVGGFAAVNIEQASIIYWSLKPKVTIPMHYKTSKLDYPILYVEEFLKGKDNIRMLNSSEVEYNKNTLPSESEIVVLQHAM